MTVVREIEYEGHEMQATCPFCKIVNWIHPEDEEKHLCRHWIAFGARGFTFISERDEKAIRSMKIIYPPKEKVTLKERND